MAAERLRIRASRLGTDGGDHSRIGYWSNGWLGMVTSARHHRHGCRLTRIKSACSAGMRTSPSKDELQTAMALLRQKDFGVELKFGNYR